jgi:hypothetical protein
MMEVCKLIRNISFYHTARSNNREDDLLQTHTAVRTWYLILIRVTDAELCTVNRLSVLVKSYRHNATNTNS